MHPLHSNFFRRETQIASVFSIGMNSKLLVSLFLVFGVLCVFVQSERLNLRDLDDTNDDSGDDSDEKRALREFLQDEDGANQFIQQARSILSSPKGRMKEAREKYEEKCRSWTRGRICPKLTDWPAWVQAFNSASGKK